jgi:nucleoside-diphosphate-sugar epimerase
MFEEISKKLAGERVLVCGGAGFVGSQLVRELLGVGATVCVYDSFFHGRRENLGDIWDDIELVVGDILDEWKLSQAFKDFKPDWVFNMVGDTYVPSAYDVPKRFFRTNVEGNINVLMACRMFDVKRILYVSSTEVYGEAVFVPMTEDHPLNPVNTYAVSKLAADRVCHTFFLEHNVPVIIARIYNAYGPRETLPYVIPEIITQLDKSNVIQLGNIKARRDFTYVQDTVRGLISTLASDIPNGEVVNVGSNVTYSVEELVAIAAEIMNRPDYRIEIDPKRMRRYDIQEFRCDYTKLNQATGWAPEVDIHDGMRRTVDWFNDHGRRWSWEEWSSGTILFDGSGG